MVERRWTVNESLSLTIRHHTGFTYDGLAKSSYNDCLLYTSVHTFRVRWTGYLTIVVLVGLLGGISMASIAGARRTQSSFATLMSRANSSQLEGLTGVYNPTIGQNGYSASLIKTIGHLPYVKDVKSLLGMNLLILNAKGAPILASEGQSRCV